MPTKDTESAVGPRKFLPTGEAADLSVQRRNWLFVLTIVMCGLGFVAVGQFPGLFYTTISARDYLVIHIAAEFLSIVVSFAVFTVGWYGYRQNRNGRDLFVGIVFLMVGLIDFVHTMSYDGMPDFLSPNTVSKASTFWIAGRLVQSLGLLAAAFVPDSSTRRRFTPSALLVVSLLAVTALVWIESRHPALLPAMYIPGVGQTALKVHLEWAVIALYGLSVYAFRRYGETEQNVVLLQMALIISIASELSFTLYTSAFDTYNLLGHFYKIAAYYLIFRALFVSSFEKPYEQLVDARDRIEHSFARIGDALASSLELKGTLQLICDLASEILGSRHAAVMLMRGGDLYVEAERGINKPPSRISVDHTIAGLAVTSRQPVVTRDVTRMEGHSPDCHCQHLEDAAARSVAAAPIMLGDDVLGVVEVYSPLIGAFGKEEADLLSSFAQQAAVAIRNSMLYERERSVAEELQRNLLPSAPDIPGLDIAVRYVPAEDVARVGGDLYDIFPLDRDNLALVIGDVCGHGLEAASIMAMTVQMTKGFLIQGMPPGQALQYMNTALCRRTGEPRFVTLFVATLNLQTHELTHASAGHHMPMVMKKEDCSIMEQQSGLPLAIDESAQYKTSATVLDDAVGIVLYTDGIIEARRGGEFFGTDKLAELCCRSINQPAAEILDTVIEQSRAWSGQAQDDVAGIIVKWKKDERK